MIAYFPKLYEDELAYSLFARYFWQSGHYQYRQAALELFENPTTRPDIEFINHLSKEVLHVLEKQISFHDLIYKHTMLPIYGLFLPKDRRELALKSIELNMGNYKNLFPRSKNKTNNIRYLRYCPLCASDDRNLYGETYWHRIHQLIGISICPKHGIPLMDSRIQISGKATPEFVCAESVIPIHMEMLPSPLSSCDINYKLSKYATKVATSADDTIYSTNIDKFLHNSLYGTPYLSKRGLQRNISLFHNDFLKYYEHLNDNHFNSIEQIQKVFNNYRFGFLEVCMMAMFLGISETALLKRELPKLPPPEDFDTKIKKLHEEGYSYPKIAKMMDTPLNTVKAIGEGTYLSRPKYKKTSQLKAGRKAVDWASVDSEMLPLVKNAIHLLRQDEDGRPRKITVHGIEQHLHLPSKRITLYLPNCRSLIESYQESYERYWAREVIWAVNKIKSDGFTLNWKSIRRLTNLSSSNFRKCRTYLNDFTDEATAHMIYHLLP